MDVIGQHLETREGSRDPKSRELARLDQRKAAEAWMLTANRPEERLLKFDRWVRDQLAERIDWTWAGAQREKRIEQCRVHLEKMVRELWRRGWMLDGHRLAKRIEELLDAVGKYQRTGAVKDFWPYFAASVNRYVGANAEEISAEAMRAGNHLGNTLAGLLQRSGAKAATLPELVAQRADEITTAKTLREKVAVERAKGKPDDGQGELL